MPTPFDKLQHIKRPHGHPPAGSPSPVPSSTTMPSQRYTPAHASPSHGISRTRDARIPTGIKGFDQMITGGLRQGSVNVLSGGPGSGKTIFAIEFLINGAEMYHEPGIFITFDERKESIIANMRELGWDLVELERQNKLVVVEYSPQQLMKILTDGGGLLDNLMGKYQAKRLAIDSISTFLMLNTGEFGRREQLVSLLKLLKKWGVTSLLTNEYTPISGNEIGKESLAVNFEMDSIIQLYYLHNSIGDDRQRYVEVFKMRGTAHVTKALPFHIGKNGITISL